MKKIQIIYPYVYERIPIIYKNIIYFSETRVPEKQMNRHCLINWLYQYQLQYNIVFFVAVLQASYTKTSNKSSNNQGRTDHICTN